MSRKRNYPEFTDEQKKIIAKNNEKVSLRELSLLLEINYSNLSGSLKKHKIFFKQKSKNRIVFSSKSSMASKINEHGEELVTDEMIKEWSYSNNQV